MFDTKQYEQKMQQAIDFFEEELKIVRTGRAHPDMLDSVMVKAYGAEVPLKQVANISVPEPQLLQVSPFDPSQVQAIAAGIRDASSLGFNPSDDGHVVRVPVPPLTEERRRELVKECREMAEQARVAVRNVRREANNKLERDEELSEDDVRREQAKIQKLTDEYVAKVEEVLKAKEAEVMEI